MLSQYILGVILVLSAAFMAASFGSHVNDLQKLPEDAPKKQELLRSALWTVGGLLVFLATVMYAAFTELIK